MTKFNEDNKKSLQKSESIIFIELSNFSLLGGTSSILVTFLGGTSQKNHPVVVLYKGVDEERAGEGFSFRKVGDVNFISLIRRGES